jgi:hypothetical protein
VLLHLPTWGDFLHHHASTVAIHQVLWIYFLGGKKTSGIRSVLDQWWHFIFNLEKAMGGVRGDGGGSDDPWLLCLGPDKMRSNER